MVPLLGVAPGKDGVGLRVGVDPVSGGRLHGQGRPGVFHGRSALHVQSISDAPVYHVRGIVLLFQGGRVMADRRLVLPQRQVGCAYFALQDMTRPAVEPLSLQEVSQGFRVHSAIEGPLGFLDGRQGIPGELLLHACFPEQFRREGRCRLHRTWAGRFGLGGKGRVRRVGRPGRGGFHYSDGAADDQD